ncbi:hypothetical protein MPTK1_7g10250 [Marchantia polymorpha subsp. ruderalis]|uniref:Vesicle transport protein n=2 Tax=Marchantia polymorpha TaxID=3197 RepID=A0AAF6BY16_MARPO|nr:hypothetical protein MARPO_0003s0045 [Marchantia polymorpha]BBN16900.1 hypothetical protein Mp_7g10250 [Marchantia polymorpha subsp. ruderalis]|eukprot:PTQ49141.1 hypothetical protein MARPO_0003s0045 [Marchantia polymorpha]
MLTTMQAWFKGGPTSEAGGQGSLLDDWNSYAGAQQSTGTGIDLESAVPESFAPLLKTANETMMGAFNSVTSRVRELPGSVSSVTTNMPSTKQIMYFGLLLAVGVFFVFLAFALFLPVMALMPQKFAITFTLGCLFIMGSFFALKGPKAQLFHMISKERLPFTCVFLASMCATIFVSMYLHSYPLSLLFSIIQVLAMLYYVLSYFPGGTTGLKFIGTFLTGSVTKLFGQ